MFENEWEEVVAKEKKEKRNRLSARDRKWNVLGMGIDGWSEQWFLTCGPGLEASATLGNYLETQTHRERGGVGGFGCGCVFWRQAEEVGIIIHSLISQGF